MEDKVQCRSEAEKDFRKQAPPTDSAESLVFPGTKTLIRRATVGFVRESPSPARPVPPSPETLRRGSNALTRASWRDASINFTLDRSSPLPSECTSDNYTDKHANMGKPCLLLAKHILAFGRWPR